MKNEKGITLMALVITLIVIGIISFTVFYTAKGINIDVEDDVLEAELQTVHHIVLQEYSKELTLGEGYTLIGNPIINSNDSTDELGIKQDKLNQGVESSKQISFIRKTTENGVERYYEYYKLTPNNLKSLGAKNATSDYLVCDETGEVANISKYKTSAGEPLYTK